MKLKKVEIKNFRSLDDVSITFVNDLMCVVGRNDVGKSNFIKAIETFFGIRQFERTDFPFKSGNDVESEICLHFDNATELPGEFRTENEFTIKMNFAKNNSSVKKTIYCLKNFIPPRHEDLGGYSNLKKIGSMLEVDFPKIKPKEEKDIEELKLRVEEAIKRNIGTQFWFDISNEWTRIKDYLPEIITVPAIQDPENEQKMTSDSSAFGSLFRVGVRKLLQQDSEGTEAVAVLEDRLKSINEDILDIVREKLLSQGNTFNLKQDATPLDVTKSFSFQMEVKDEYGITTPLSQRGNGLQRSVLMAIIRAQNEIHKRINKKEELPNRLGKYIYLIEEPEAFLHLSAQRELYYSIKELIRDGSQALITTHSTLFMDEGDIGQVVLLLREEGKTSATQALDLFEVKENIGEIVQVSKLMTGKVCCLVEGISDVFALKSWTETLGCSYKELGIYFIDMKGCSNAEYFANVKVIKDFNVNFLIVLDTDFHSRERVTEIKHKLKKEYRVGEHQFIELREGEIENYFPIKRVEQVLGLDEFSINEEEYAIDPKKAMKNAKDRSGSRAKRYIESRDSSRIAKSMKKEEIHPEIVDLINQLIKAAGGSAIEDNISQQE